MRGVYIVLSNGTLEGVCWPNILFRRVSDILMNARTQVELTKIGPFVCIFSFNILAAKHPLTHILLVPPSSCYSKWQCICGNEGCPNPTVTNRGDWLRRVAAASPPSQNSQSLPLGQQALIKISCHQGHGTRKSSVTESTERGDRLYYTSHITGVLGVNTAEIHRETTLDGVLVSIY